MPGVVGGGQPAAGMFGGAAQARWAGGGCGGAPEALEGAAGGR
ncbi:MAG: hypothetical protein ACSLFA_22765 [Mycobacterium sp.]